MTRRLCLASFLVWHAIPFAAFSQKTDPALQPFAFLSGRWTSDSSEAQEEEYRSPVTGRSMVGTFRVSKDGDAVFYEFCVIEVEDGREEKADMVRLNASVNNGQDVLFSNSDGSLSLRYQRTGDELVRRAMRSYV